MPDAKLRDYSIDGADLDAGAAAAIAQCSSIDMILAVRLQEGQHVEPVDDVLGGPRTGKSLQQFLEDKAGGHNRIATIESFSQLTHFRSPRGLIPPEGERPDAGVNEKTHRRERSAL